LHARSTLSRLRKPSCVSELSAKIQSAAKAENVSQHGVADSNLSRKFKSGLRTREELRALAPGASRRKYKDPIHRKEEFTHTSKVRSDVIGSKPMSKKTEINVAGKRLTVSNLEKVLYPEVGFTKGQVIDYYIRIAPVLLPHLKGRPITLKRYPEGVNGFFFYEKRCPSHRPSWVKTAAVPSRREEKRIDYCVMDDLPALIWAANLADLELHTFLHRAPAITRPTTIAFDLDPGPPVDIVLCCKVGLWLKAMFESLNLQSFPKTSGSKGLQVFVPLNTATTYDRTKEFARALAERLEREHPDLVVSRMQKALRKGKVLIDWSQNDDHKTTVNVYSLRAKSQPTVSTPVTWKEVELTARKADAQFLVFDSEAALRRVKKHGDLFEPVLRLKQRLPKLESVS
jgi:bifunctional non-homologous end joining protein LigD